MIAQFKGRRSRQTTPFIWSDPEDMPLPVRDPLLCSNWYWRWDPEVVLQHPEVTPLAGLELAQITDDAARPWSVQPARP